MTCTSNRGRGTLDNGAGAGERAPLLSASRAGGIDFGAPRSGTGTGRRRIQPPIASVLGVGSDSNQSHPCRRLRRSGRLAALAFDRTRSGNMRALKCSYDAGVPRQKVCCGVAVELAAEAVTGYIRPSGQAAQYGLGNLPGTAGRVETEHAALPTLCTLYSACQRPVRAFTAQ